MSCSGLTSVTISNSVVSIGAYVFAQCTGLISITIPNSVLSIGELAFRNCSSLTSVTIPSSVKSILSSAFMDCSSLTSVHITDLEAWCKIVFYSINSNPLCFAHHLYLNGVEIKDLVIPNSLTSIGEFAFYGCSGITSVSIPNSVSSIESGAFVGCRIESVLTLNSKTKNYATDGKAFSNRTYQHAMLYIPEGTWSEAIYDGDWYLFNNIRETTMRANALSPTQVYTLMDTNTFGYAVYDETNNRVEMAKAFYSIDEQDPNNCWLVLTQAGKKYLYNVGAKKYATISSDGRIVLTANATAIEVMEGEDGLILGSDTSRRWGFVKNSSQTDITGITPQITNSGQSANSYYSIAGQRILSPQKGVNIVRMSDGMTKKIVVKSKDGSRIIVD